jgi:tetratricopeptide (TPR) repeat protein
MSPRLFWIAGAVIVSLLIFPVSAWTQNQEALMAEAYRLNQQVMEMYGKGQYVEAIPLARKSLDLLEKAVGPNHHIVGTPLNNLAQLLQASGNYAGAQPLYERALKLYEPFLGPTHPAIAKTFSNLANVLVAQGRYEEAEPLYERAMRIQEGAPEKVNPDLVTT